HAKSLMRETKLSLREISAACGFANEAQLSRLFRKEVGVAPRRWRKTRTMTGRTGYPSEYRPRQLAIHQEVPVRRQFGPATASENGRQAPVDEALELSRRSQLSL